MSIPPPCSWPGPDGPGACSPGAHEEAYVAGQIREDVLLGLELHDGLLQELAVLQLQLGRLRMSLGRNVEVDRARVTQLSEALRRCSQGARRTSTALSRAAVPVTLAAGLHTLVEEERRRFEGVLKFHTEGAALALGPRLRRELVRGAEQVLGRLCTAPNCYDVTVELSGDAGAVRLKFVADAALAEPAECDLAQLNLKSTERRVRELGGRCTVEVDVVRGTSITVEVPLEPQR